MKKLLLFLSMFVCFFMEASEQPEGLGTEESPFLITTISNLVWLQENISDTNIIPSGSYFKQTQNINAVDTKNWDSGNGFLPILTNVYISINYDGGNYCISNLYINRPEEDYIGLFGKLENSTIKNMKLYGEIKGCEFVGSIAGMIKNTTMLSNEFHGKVIGEASVGGLIGECTIENNVIDTCSVIGNISGDYSVGGLIGWNEAGMINNCFVSGKITGNDEVVGGLIGDNGYDIFKTCNINNSYVNGEVIGKEYVGGLIGWKTSGSISNCYLKGDVSGEEYIGGLVGWNSGFIDHSYVTGTIFGVEYVGGLAGESEYGIIKNCYIVGTISGEKYVGGLVGKGHLGTINNNYVSGTISGKSSVAGIIGTDSGFVTVITNSYYNSNKYQVASAYARSEAELKQQITFEDWDFENVWEIKERVSFPYFRDVPIPEPIGLTILIVALGIFSNRRKLN